MRLSRVVNKVCIPRPLLAGAMVLAAWLRCAGLTAREPTNDEAFSWRMAQFPTHELLRRLAADAHPPLHYLVLKAWTALFGDSVCSLRSLSGVLGVLTLGALYGFARQVARRATDPAPEAGCYVSAMPALLAVWFFAVSPFQVFHARIARMYTLGTLLAVLSSWWFLRAVSDRRQRWSCWMAYAASAAAFAYSHYYAVFTLAAHAMYATGVVASGLWKGQRLRPAALALRGGWAALVFLVLYLPWVPTMREQTRSVQAGFWIPAITLDGLRPVLFYFLTGLRDMGPLAEYLGGLTATLVLGSLSRSRHPASRLVLLLILAPWVGGVGLSWASGRPIVLERYLLFAHLFYLAGLAIAIAMIQSVLAKGLLIALVMLNSLFGTFEQVELRRCSPSGLDQAVHRLAEDYAPGELVLVGGPTRANQVLYALSRAGLDARVRVVGVPLRGGAHQVHAAAIREPEWLAPDRLATLPDGRVWAIGQMRGDISYPAHWRVARFERFGVEEIGWWYLMRVDCTSPKGL